MSVVISDDVLAAARMSEDELKLELAVLLFEKEKLTLGQASRLAGGNLYQFQHMLASRNLSLHYDVAEFEADLQTLRNPGRL